MAKCMKKMLVMIKAYLHDELDRTNEVAEELENQVLLLLLHLVQAVPICDC